MCLLGQTAGLLKSEELVFSGQEVPDKKLTFSKKMTMRMRGISEIMAHFTHKEISLQLLTAIIVLISSGCASAPPHPITLPAISEYSQAPHPSGFELAQLNEIFNSPQAPKAALGEFADTCDEEYKKLSQTTPSTSTHGQKKSALELVKKDPEMMHWCFYAKISRLQDYLQRDTSWSARQKKVLEAFEFLSPIANAFQTAYHDDRYLSWSTHYYSKISEWVFFKKAAGSRSPASVNR